MESLKQKIDFLTRWLMRHPFKRTITRKGDLRIGRNDKCYCGSRKKFKKCHLKEYQDRLAQLAAQQSPELRKVLKKEKVWASKKYKKLTASQKNSISKPKID